MLFCSGNRANWSLTVKQRRMHGLSDVTVVDAGILLASFARRFLVLLLELQLIHHLFLDRHDACLRRVWLLGFFVLEVAVTQGGRVDLLLADELLNARVGQHLTLLRVSSGLPTDGLTRSLWINEELILSCFDDFALGKICLRLLQSLFSHLLPQLFCFDQGVVGSVCLSYGISGLNLRLFHILNFRLWYWLGFKYRRRLALSFLFLWRWSDTLLRQGLWFLLDSLKWSFFVCLCQLSLLFFALLFLLYLFFQGLVSFRQILNQLTGL